ncbi:M24 family metallopeptidase [Georgenia yuyongxinii]|uniref:Aminopeptidase P family protein n=1 Tax=Georgenia yuyongxinii TaxID=2589797 RepID=A0A552WXZ7_9MICO|nr:Xaa-Pro peptidase family protein [Georgenia yuyongxinii]TRW47555.1 aminopeptidase P family protein [Georgenia yuyongxinii]
MTASTTNIATETGQEKSLVFPREEYAARMARTRAAMAEQGLDTLVVMGPEDLYYLTGYRSMGFFAWQALIVRADGTPVMFSRDLERRIYLNNSWAEEYLAYDDHQDPVTTFVGLLHDLGAQTGRIGIPSSGLSISANDVARLARELPGATWHDTTTLLPGLRLVKSELEIAKIRQAAEFTRIGMHAAVEACVVGNTENDVAAACLDAMIRAGSEDPSLGPLVGAGFRAPFGHAAWERTRLGDGDLIFIECGGAMNRYHAGAMRTVALGRMDDTRRRLEAASRDGLNAGLAALKPGATSGEVDAAARAAVDKHGLGEYFNHRSGYSIGLGFRTWIEGMSLRPHDDTVITEGMVVHVVPALSDDVTMMAISETALVTAAGAEPLVNLEKQVWVR